MVVTIEPLLQVPCIDEAANTREYPNPDYVDDICRQERFAVLLFLTREECSYARRLVFATVLGGIIGWERRQADRPAGIRTMALVSLASALFCLDSSFAFRSSPQGWDSSRVAAAIPSGVGFLGSALIFKAQASPGDGMPVVHGLTTAASLWMSAAVGIACGGELYFAASFTTAILLVLLRFGPRNDDINDETNGDDIDGDEDDLEEARDRVEIPTAIYGSQAVSERSRLKEGETTSLISGKSPRRKSAKQKAHLV